MRRVQRQNWCLSHSKERIKLWRESGKRSRNNREREIKVRREERASSKQVGGSSPGQVLCGKRGEKGGISIEEREDSGPSLAGNRANQLGQSSCQVERGGEENSTPIRCWPRRGFPGCARLSLSLSLCAAKGNCWKPQCWLFLAFAAD